MDPTSFRMHSRSPAIASVTAAAFVTSPFATGSFCVISLVGCASKPKKKINGSSQVIDLCMVGCLVGWFVVRRASTTPNRWLKTAQALETDDAWLGSSAVPERITNRSSHASAVVTPPSEINQLTPWVVVSTPDHIDAYTHYLYLCKYICVYVARIRCPTRCSVTVHDHKPACSYRQLYQRRALYRQTPHAMC